MSKGFMSAGGKAALVDGEQPAVFNIRLEGASASLGVALLNVDGGAAANTQFLQDMEGNLYYTVFGPKITSMSFTCADPRELCRTGSIAKGDDVLNVLKNSIAQRNLPVGTMVYGKSTFKGYVVQVDLKNGYREPVFVVSFIGTFV